MDDDFDEDQEAAEAAEALDSRAKQLGFRPQKEIIYNKLLPYTDLMDRESTEWFLEIKTNLAKSLALREIRPGFITWMSRLNKYLRFYGFKFTKEDHLSLIHMLFEYVILPDLEPWLVNKTANLLVNLLKRKELLKPDELELPWRPLYQLYERLMFSPFEPLGMLQFPPVLESSLRMLNRSCRAYFPRDCTAEMMDEWRPLMCPFDVTMGKAMAYYEMFLPTYDVHDRKESSYLLWFSEFMSFWDACHNSPPWEPNLMSMYARLAEHNIGAIDWEPFIPTIFTRIQKNFNLPVMYKQTNVGNKSQTLDVLTHARWIVYTLGKSSSTQKYLGQMFQALESYYHPANYGRHTQKLMDFLSKLVHLFIKRLNRERYAKPKWGNVVPAEHRLTDEEVTEFVLTLKPIALHSMYSKLGFIEAGSVLQHLATLRPELIVPSLVERMEEALGTLTEPHKLTASMHAVVSVSRTLVHPGPKYPAGPAAVIPLLLETLPGIDPNDMRKAMVTFQFMSTFCTLIPIVDSSNAFQHYPNLSEEERLICGQTAQFEDFVIQFLDRCFALIESSSLEQTREEISASDHRASREESMKDIGMASTFSSMLVQCSAELFDVALKKVHSYVDGRILETKISGKIAAGLCRCLCKVKPEKGLKVFLPSAIQTVSRLIKEHTVKEESLDDELMFNLLVISECVRAPGEHLLPFVDSLEPILVKTLHMASKDGYSLVTSILRNILRSLTITSPKEYRSIPDGYDRPVQEYLPIKDWGKPGNIKDLKIQWHIPSEEELRVAQVLLDKFLGAELDALSKFAAGQETLSKEQVQNHLTIVNHILHGCGSLLPFWREESVKLVDSLMKTDPFDLLVSPKEMELTLRGGNARLAIIDVMDKVQACLLKDTEDDTKSLQTVISIYHGILLFGGLQRENYESRAKSYHLIKKGLDNKLVGNRRQIRALIIDRTLLQHESRLLEKIHTPLTATHVKVLQNVLTLATSHYSNVRIKAQDVLLRSANNFSHSYKALIPRLTELLQKDEAVSHEQFKGALYVVLGHKNKTMLTKHSWETMESLWPVLIEAQHSEKPSIIKLLDCVIGSIFRSMDTFALTSAIPDSVVEKAKLVHGAAQFPSEEMLVKGLSRLEAGNRANLQLFESLLQKLCTLIESGKLRWRHYNMAIGMLGILTRYDFVMPARVARILIQNLNHENIVVRKSSLHLVGCVLKQQKRSHPKIEIKPVPDPSLIPVVPGDREDNMWMCYDTERAPKTAEQWDEPRYVHKTHYGYYTWPSKMLVYAPSAQQPRLDRPFEDLNDVEKELHLFFGNQASVDQLMRYLSLEELKGRDKFDPRRFCMFKGLFRNFGDTFLPQFRPHLERLVAEGLESGTRCVAEIVAALVRGSKHWPFKMTEDMYSWLAPLIRLSLSKVSVETITDWGTCFATASESRDPHRIHWLLDVLMEEPLRSQGSFMDSSRLYVLQGGIAQQEWRAGKMLHKLVALLRPFYSHPYQNVRDRIGSVLTNIFLNDLEYSDRPEASNKRSPRVADFIREVLPQLEILAQEENGGGGGGNGGPVNGGMPPPSPQRQLQQQHDMRKQFGGLVPPEILAQMQNVPPEMLAANGIAADLLAQISPERLFEAISSAGGNMLPVAMEMGDGMGSSPGGFSPAETPGTPAEGIGRKPHSSPEREHAIRLLQTVCKFLSGSLMRAFNPVKPESYLLLPVLCVNDSNEFEPNLSRDCTVTLACLSQSLLPPTVIPQCLEAVVAVAKSTSWKAKTAVLDFLQVMTFNNLPTIVSQPQWVDQVMQVVKEALEDDRVEVREKAGIILGGLLHCEFINKERKQQLLDSFLKEAGIKIRKLKTKDESSAKESESKRARSILRRHSGILGLCAFVNAYPYDVPEFVPNILMVLSDHLHDPLPIPLTIKKTLQDFKRTHQDNWQDHKQKFSDDQLAVITDLLVSPSYYA